MTDIQIVLLVRKMLKGEVVRLSGDEVERCNIHHQPSVIHQQPSVLFTRALRKINGPSSKRPITFKTVSNFPTGSYSVDYWIDTDP